ncbi:equilibrative nucleoside transporter 3 isoform X2 [Salmo salar]|uniref:Equilibrative nucleoside transporter 3 isoform X2 n=1 Tax=Salmo salar TaxID=8030 RepID=A0ABM3DHM3_SALSA|nr:equilibrative nucleoside transporter 3 isoform X2 [Salmo salar]
MMADGTESLQASVNSYWPASPIHASSMSDEEMEGQVPDEIDRAPLLPKQHHAGPPGATGRPLASRHCPEDSYCMVYMIFFLLGIGSLLPWNFFITAKHYWTYKLSNNTDDHGEEPRSDLSEYFESYLAIASTVPSVLCLVLNYLLVNRLSPAVRILSSLLIILAVFIVTTVMVKVDSSGCREQFFFGTLASVAMVSGASNLFSGSVFGISGHFPMRISQALISGQAMGGTISAIASIVDLAAAKDVTDSALAYFLTADVFILLCIIMYLLLPKLAYSRHYMLAAEFNSAGSQPEPRDEVDGQEGAPTSTVSSVSIPPLKPILQKTWLLGFCVFYVFFISITVFPAVSSGIQDSVLSSLLSLLTRRVAAPGQQHTSPPSPASSSTTWLTSVVVRPRPGCRFQAPPVESSLPWSSPGQSWCLSSCSATTSPETTFTRSSSATTSFLSSSSVSWASPTGTWAPCP